MKILITGAGGFLGSDLLNKIISREDCDIYFVHYEKNDNVRYESFGKHNKCYLDLSVESSIEKMFNDIQPDIVVHMAWYVEHHDYKNSLRNFDHIKITYRILQNFVKHKGKRFIFIGTCFEKEENFSNIYSKSKDVCSFFIRDFAKTFKFEYSILRPSFLYGIGEPDTKLIPNIISKMIKNQPIECSVPNNYLNFINVNDVSKAITNILFKGKLLNNEVNIFDDQNYSIREFILYCAEKLNYDKLKITFKENSKYEMNLYSDMKDIGCLLDRSFFQYIDEIIDHYRSILLMKNQ